LGRISCSGMRPAWSTPSPPPSGPRPPPCTGRRRRGGTGCRC